MESASSHCLRGQWELCLRHRNFVPLWQYPDVLDRPGLVIWPTADWDQRPTRSATVDGSFESVVVSVQNGGGVGARTEVGAQTAATLWRPR